MIKSKYNIINLRTFVNSDHTREDLINKVFSGFSSPIKLIQNEIGGFMTFLEYKEDNKFLKHFYEAHGYREFDSREEGKGRHRLAMALKFL